MKPDGTWIEEAKRKAALEAVKHVKDGFIVGLGSGSTAAYAIEALGERISRERLNVLGIPTSYQAFLLAVEQSIAVTTLEEHPTISLTIDGADQIDPQLNLIKGMGAALAREKIVASASKQNIIIADQTKKVQVLGEKDHPVPVEVLPFAISLVKRRIAELGGKAVVREGKGKVGPVITDNGNVVIDAVFGPISDAAKLEQKLKM
ncbi:ribose-5-phosphate isomerase RpiA, partial [Candidatus Bathyarchaeota archaeon]|nr:ribose-5-phosphate isomerase RpiA [Candidatus Bathyarchaeota archaeon]